jgi:hypothetical protein
VKIIGIVRSSNWLNRKLSWEKCRHFDNFLSKLWLSSRLMGKNVKIGENLDLIWCKSTLVEAMIFISGI